MIPLVVTASPRDYLIHQRCFASIAAAGFRDVTICSEPKTFLLGVAHGMRQIQNPRRLGQWANFVQALEYALTSGTQYLMTCEDDVIFCRHTAIALESMTWPSDRCGCLQVYSAAEYATTLDLPPSSEATVDPQSSKLTMAAEMAYPLGRSRLAKEHAFDMLGACALMFRQDAALALLRWAYEKGWRGDPYSVIDDPVEKKAADTFVGEVLTFLDFEIWIQNPSLADHIGDVSTLGHKENDSPRRRALNWPGENADARMILRGATPCPA